MPYDYGHVAMSGLLEVFFIISCRTWGLVMVICLEIHV